MSGSYQASPFAPAFYISGTIKLVQEVRAMWRLARLGLLLLLGLAIVGFIFPYITSTTRQTQKHRWSRKLLKALGVHIGQPAQLPPGAAVIVCNHISWLDIFVLNALTHAHFVCKDEVRSWPIVGWLVRNTGTIFIERGSRSAAAKTAKTINNRLCLGERVALFPEGTTTNGTKLLPFRAALFQPAIDAKVPAIPVALRYLDRAGNDCLAPAYDGDVTFWQCLRKIVLAQAICTRVDFLTPLSPDSTRRTMAVDAETAIAKQLGVYSIPAVQEKSA